MSTFSFDIAAALAGAVSHAGAADLAGLMGVGLGSSWALFRSRRTILACQSMGSLSFACHYLLLGSPTAAIACAMSLLQAVTGICLGERRRLLAGIYAASFLVVLAGAALSWRGLPSAFALGGAFLAMLGRWQREPQKMRLVFLCSSFCWLGHNLSVGSAFGLVSDALSLTATSTGLWRNRSATPAAVLRRWAARLAPAPLPVVLRAR